MMLNPDSLKPGDCLLYAGKSPIDRVIQVKTWSRYSHVEIYVGDGMSVASRNGIGVNCYTTRLGDLAAVRRPGYLLNLDAARVWHKTVAGQKYDWLGILCFTLAVRQGSPDRQFCSEYARNFYRAGGWDLFNPAVSSDTVAPAQLWQTPLLTTIWEDTHS